MEEEDSSFASPHPSYVPSGLASFVARAQATLHDATQLNFQSPSPQKSITTTLSEEETSFQIQEDDDDRRFKQEVMDKFEKNDDTVSSSDDSKAEAILETSNRLLSLEQEGDEVEFTQSDMTSPTRVEQEGNDDIPSTLVGNVTIDEKRETLNDADSFFVDLLGTESTVDMPISPEVKGVDLTELGVLIAPGSKAVSPEKSETRNAAEANGVDLLDIESIADNVPVQDRSLVDFFSSPQNDALFKDMLSMSVAPGCTSPLERAENSKLSASTPELTKTSPFRKAFQNMAARLDSASPGQSPSSTEPSPASRQSAPSRMEIDTLMSSIPSPPSTFVPAFQSTDKGITMQPTTTLSKSPTIPAESETRREVKDTTTLGVSGASPVVSSVDSAPPNKDAIKTIASQAAEKQREERTQTKFDWAVAPSASTEDDSFFPNRRMSLAAVSPPTRRPVQASKSEVSKPVPRPSSNVTDRSKLRKSMPATKKCLDRQRIPSTSTRTTVSMQSTSTTGSSRLIQGTTATQARTKSASPPSGIASTRGPSTATSHLYQGTAATQPRSKLASPPSRVAARSKASTDEGVTKAKERVRQQKLTAAKKAKEAEAAEVKKPETRSSTRGTALTVEEGRKLARERIRQRQEKENRVRLSNQMTANRTAKRPTQGTSTSASSRASSAASQRRVTVPKSPQFATKEIHGDKARGRSTRGSVSTLNPNPITRALGSPTHGDKSTVATTRSSSRPRLTVPKAPRLSTSAKYGDTPLPSLRAKLPEPTPRLAPPKKRELKVTQPVPFHFHSSKASTPAHTPEKEEPSLAQSMDLFVRKGLRDSRSSSPPKTWVHKLTIAKSPNFSTITQRPKPKSTAEMEEEIMAYYATHPFKANAVGAGIEVDKGPAKKVPKRRLTQPVPFHLRSDERAAHSKPPFISPDKESLDLEECTKQFHARPLPRLSYKPPPRKEAAVRSVTTPEPFNFPTERRPVKSEPHGPTPDDVELPKQFHARPLPQTTYTGPKNTGRRHSGVPRTIITPRPPKLATSARTEPREVAREASRKNAEMMAKRREEMSMKKKRDKHHEDMAKASLMSPPLNIEPFHLQSEARHEAYQQKLAEQRAIEEEEKKRLMLFRARPIRISSPPPVHHSERPATTPQPFPLKSVARHEQWQVERCQQLEEEERERQRLMTVKANPLPRSTYKYSPATPPLKKKSKQGDEEEKDLDSARKKAMEALLNAEELVSPESQMPPAQDAGYYSLTRKVLGI
jgi:hypothetical protein